MKALRLWYFLLLPLVLFAQESPIGEGFTRFEHGSLYAEVHYIQAQEALSEILPGFPSLTISLQSSYWHSMLLYAGIEYAQPQLDGIPLLHGTGRIGLEYYWGSMQQSWGQVGLGLALFAMRAADDSATGLYLADNESDYGLYMQATSPALHLWRLRADAQLRADMVWTSPEASYFLSGGLRLGVVLW
jgi:hypothetical protein